APVLRLQQPAGHLLRALPEMHGLREALVQENRERYQNIMNVLQALGQMDPAALDQAAFDGYQKIFSNLSQSAEYMISGGLAGGGLELDRQEFENLQKIAQAKSMADYQAMDLQDRLSLLRICQTESRLLTMQGHDGINRSFVILEVRAAENTALAMDLGTGALQRIVIAGKDQIKQARQMQRRFKRKGIPGLAAFQFATNNVWISDRVTGKPLMPKIREQRFIVMDEPSGQTARSYLQPQVDALRAKEQEIREAEEQKEKLVKPLDELKPDLELLQNYQWMLEGAQTQLARVNEEIAGLEAQKRQAGWSDAEQARLDVLYGRRNTLQNHINGFQRQVSGQQSVVDQKAQALSQGTRSAGELADNLNRELQTLYERLGLLYHEREILKQDHLARLTGLAQKFQKAVHQFEQNGLVYTGSFDQVLITPEGDVSITDYYQAREARRPRRSFYQRFKLLFFDFLHEMYDKGNIERVAGFMEYLNTDASQQTVLKMDAQAFADFVKKQMEEAEQKVNRLGGLVADLQRELDADPANTNTQEALAQARAELARTRTKTERLRSRNQDKYFFSEFNFNLNSYNRMITQARQSHERANRYAWVRSFAGLKWPSKLLYIGGMLAFAAGGAALAFVMIFSGTFTLFLAGVILAGGMLLLVIDAMTSRGLRGSKLAVAGMLLALVLGFVYYMPLAVIMVAGLGTMLLVNINQDALRAADSGELEYTTKQAFIGDEHQFRAEDERVKAAQRRGFYASTSQMDKDLNTIWSKLHYMIKDRDTLRRNVTEEEVKKAIAAARLSRGKKPGEKIRISISTTFTDWWGIYLRNEMPGTTRTIDKVLQKLGSYGLPAGTEPLLDRLAVDGRLAPKDGVRKADYLDDYARRAGKIAAEDLKLLYEIQRWLGDIRADEVASELRRLESESRERTAKMPSEALGGGYRDEDQALRAVVSNITSPGRNGVLMPKHLQTFEMEKLHEMIKRLRNGRSVDAEEAGRLAALWEHLLQNNLADPESIEDLMRLSDARQALDKHLKELAKPDALDWEQWDALAAASDFLPPDIRQAVRHRNSKRIKGWAAIESPSGRMALNRMEALNEYTALHFSAQMGKLAGDV
ncbi:hypothetical protein JW933_03320, partial [candidate division FCPU426 bacterium]|nr:hypothetical protein [candidate division FCPU426 bacterium]